MTLPRTKSKRIVLTPERQQRLRDHMKETKRILKEQGLQGNVGIKGKDITKDIGWKEKKREKQKQNVST
ncbi:MAG: hypothetical protein WBQ25_14455 [Nitrososphaeraceae archaeon]